MLRKSSAIEILEARIAPAATFSQFNLLTDIDGTNGFTLTGGGAGGVDVEITAVANAGDVNGDGVKDLLIGIPFDSNSSVGRVALILGRTGGFPTNLSLDSLGANAVLIQGEVNFDRLGEALAGVGDVNDDGFDDFVIGAPGQDVGVVSSERGAAYVIFGQATWGTSFALSALDGTNGFKIVGDTRRTGNDGIAQAVGGYNLAGAGAGGDFNGDGFADILVGAPDIQAFAAGGASSGAAFVIFGKRTSGAGGSAFTTPLSVANLDGTNGLMIGSSVLSDFMGSEVGFVGDVNGDGLTDLSLGNQANPTVDNRTSFVVFGKATGNPASIDLASLTAQQGFEGPAPSNVNFQGPLRYGSEYVLRDIDGDGDEDLGVSFVQQPFLADAIQGYAFVKNKGSGYTANPFGKPASEVRQVLLGFSNATVDADRYDLGDFNGDGFYDIASFPPFVTNSLPDVFFGKAPAKSYTANNADNSSGVSFTGLTIPISNGSLDPQTYFVGDVSGDGIDDVLVLPSPSSNAAAANAYIVFGNAINPSTDGRTVVIRDVDGDTVTVKTTKGVLTQDMFTVSHPVGAVENGQQIDLLDLTVGDAASDAAFSGANITISVKKSKTGDGKANVGAINAAGIDLGNVVIAGGLGAIDAGDNEFDQPGLGKLDVHRFGRTATGPAVPSSDIVGRIGKLVVDTEFDRTTLNVTGAATEGIGSLAVAGNFSGIVNLAGPLGTFKALDLVTGTILNVDGVSARKTSITAHVINAGVLIDVASVIGKLTAAQIGDATIFADRLDKLSVTGDKRASIAGDLAADITLDNAGATGDVKALGSAKVAGRFHDATIAVAGSIGTFSAGAMQGASLFAGFTPTSAAAPLGGGTFLAAALFKTFTITGKATLLGGAPTSAAMDDSFVGATALGATKLPTIDTTSGAVLWGFAYRDAIKSLKIKDPSFTYDTDAGGTQAVDDFSVRVL